MDINSKVDGSLLSFIGTEFRLELMMRIYVHSRNENQLCTHSNKTSVKRNKLMGVVLLTQPDRTV